LQITPAPATTPRRYSPRHKQTLWPNSLAESSSSLPEHPPSKKAASSASQHIIQKPTMRHFLRVFPKNNQKPGPAGTIRNKSPASEQRQAGWNKPEPAPIKSVRPSKSASTRELHANRCRYSYPPFESLPA